MLDSRPARQRFWVIGHRGSPVHEPENTIASFDRALSHDGANGIELDVCMTKDGELVVWHDWRPARWIARFRRWGLEPFVHFRPFLPSNPRLHRRVSKLYADDVLRHFGYAEKRGPHERIASAPVVTLDEALAFAAKQSALDVVFFDVKIPPDEAHLAPLLVRRLRALCAAHAGRFRAIVETCYAPVLAAMKAAAPDLCFTLDTGPLVGVWPSAERWSSVRRAFELHNGCATIERPRKICVLPFKTLTRIAQHDVELARTPRVGTRPKVVTFTVNHEAEMRHLIALGVDGVQTDFPARLRALADDAQSRVSGHEPLLATGTTNFSAVCVAE